MAKLHAARCPSCGANIQVPPQAHSTQCRYCGNVITIQHQKPPPMMHMQHGMPSTTLYIDPEEIAKAGRKFALILTTIILLSVFLPAIIGVVVWMGGRMKSTVKPFPAECASYGETIEMSGDYTGTGPIVSKVEGGCKIHITNAKLKGSTLAKATGSNIEITLENVTVETTDAVIQGDSNLKIHLVNSTLKSTGGPAIKTGYNLQMDASASKIIGKKNALDVEANAKLTFKNASELTAEGVALKTTSGLVIDAEGGKLDGGEGAIVASSGAKITGKNVIFSAKTGETLHFTSGTNLDLDGGAITSGGDAAIQADGGDFSFDGTKVQGTTNAISGGNGFKLKAAKKAALVATSGDGIELTSNGNLVLTDATVEGTRNGIKATVNTKVKMSQGARVTGKSGGILTTVNTEIDANGATIDGGTGPGLEFGSNGRIQVQQGGLKGTPALKSTYKPQVLALDGTKVEGEQQIAKR